MADFIRYLQKYADIQPRTYWYEIPFYKIIRRARQKFYLGNRPEDLEHIATIEKRAWERHLTHLNRLERFPLDKAEYYIRLKESHGVNSMRGIVIMYWEPVLLIETVKRPVDTVIESESLKPVIADLAA